MGEGGGVARRRTTTEEECWEGVKEVVKRASKGLKGGDKYQRVSTERSDIGLIGSCVYSPENAIGRNRGKRLPEVRDIS